MNFRRDAFRKSVTSVLNIKFSLFFITDKPSNKLNYLKNNDSEEKCGETQKFLPHVVDAVQKKENGNKYENTINIHQGYETPVKIPRPVKTPSNEDPQYYTDMEKGNELKK